MQGKDGVLFTTICGYRAPETSIIQAGESTAWKTQWSMLRASGIQKPDPRQQFFTDLLVYIQQLKRDKHEIFVMLDANETTDARNGPFDKFVTDSGLIDLYKYRHPPTSETKPINSHISGKEQIDYGFGTPKVAEATV
jgi:hypothetical protein